MEDLKLPALNSKREGPSRAVSDVAAELIGSPIAAELFGSRRCEALGIVTTDNAPILALCRELLAQGVDPDRAVVAYRNGIEALRVRSVGEAAKLEINSKGTDFVRHRDVRTASPVRKSEPPFTGHWLDWPPAS